MRGTDDPVYTNHPPGRRSQLPRRLLSTTTAVLAAGALALGTAATAGAAGVSNGQQVHRLSSHDATSAPRIDLHALPAGVASIAVVPTSKTSVDVAGPVSGGVPTGATTVSVPDGAVGSAIAPDGSVALEATKSGTIDVITSPLTSPTAGTPIDVSNFTAEGGSGYHSYNDGVAITPDGKAGLATADSQGAIALVRSGSTYVVNTAVQSPGLNQAGQPHQPGWIEAPGNATTYDGVVISQSEVASGNYVGLLMDASDNTIAVVTGVGSPYVKVAGTVSDPMFAYGYNGSSDYGTGGMAFSPTTTTRAVTVTRTGFAVLDLSNPMSPSVLSSTAIAGASSGSVVSTAVAPDGNHVAVAAGSSLYFYSGLAKDTVGTPLTSSASPITFAGPIASIAYAKGGNLIVNYGTSTGKLAVVTGTETATPAYTASQDLALSGPAPDVNGMAVLPAEAGAKFNGYVMAASDGGVFSFGQASYQGSAGGQALISPIVGLAADTSADGYWLVSSSGAVDAFGGASDYGSMANVALKAPIVGMAATPDGKGYWLVASDGGVFSFGDAHFYGSADALHLNRPVVGMATTPDGKGYWLVASDGGVFSYGDAVFRGSTGAMTLNKPVVGMAPTLDGNGYWLVASDGGVFSFGDAAFHGSTVALTLNKPIVGMVASPDGMGYWLAASDGGVFAFGDAAYQGSLGAVTLNKPIIGIAI